MTNKNLGRLVFLSVVLVGLFVGAGVAFAAGVAPDPATDPSGFFGALLGAVQGKQWWLLASTAVVGLTWVLRVGVARKSTSWLKWFNTDRGGVALTAIVSVLGGFATSAAAGTSPGWGFLIDCLKVMVGAIGQYVAIKKIVAPADKAAA